ncbi:hypothetical protein [Paraclostridium dentum]|uniref:hypothetical protein n=1 Tax=Paraclostridium dentum TaxID=2662455 RepID=UPI003F32E835
MNLIEPVECVLGLDPSTGKKDTFQYIPILKVLRLICNDHDILTHIFRPDPSAPESLTDFSEIYQENIFFNTDEPSLRIQLYSDKFEIANPLGSKRLLHKGSAFYFTLGNIPPKYRSALKNIHLLILVKHRLVKKYGFDRILEPFILEERQYCIKGGLATVSADNLTTHSLAGFSGFFSNGRICRFCMCHYEDLSKTISDENCVLRTKAVHAVHEICKRRSTL